MNEKREEELHRMKSNEKRGEQNRRDRTEETEKREMEMNYTR